MNAIMIKLYEKKEKQHQSYLQLMLREVRNDFYSFWPSFLSRRGLVLRRWADNGSGESPVPLEAY